MPDLKLNRYEKAIYNCSSKKAKEDKLFTSSLAGVSRAVRLSRTHGNQHLQTIWDTAANVIGPTFLFFIWWVLESAKKQKGIERLYFIARDGQIFLKIAEIISQQWGYPFECKYLYGSRQAWFFPAIKELSPYEIKWITGPWTPFLSINLVCKRIHLIPSEIEAQLSQYGFQNKDWERNLSQKERENLRTLLQTNQVSELIQKKVKISFENTQEYLKQEGITGKANYAFVDIGWTGRSLVALSQILEKASLRPSEGIKSFFFGLNQSKRIFKNDEYFTFLFDFSRSFKRLRLYNGYIYETFAAADHGRTIGYKKEGSVLKPILDEENNADWGIATQQESILKFTKKFTMVYSPNPSQNIINDKNLFKILDVALDEFINSPSLEEADVYGSYKAGSELIEHDLNEIAPIVTHKNFWIPTLLDKRVSAWPMASFIRSQLSMKKISYKFYQFWFLLKTFILFIRDHRKEIIKT